jgi:hypothetical protein
MILTGKTTKAHLQSRSEQATQALEGAIYALPKCPPNMQRPQHAAASLERFTPP